jgi:hypothetical protein
MIESTAFLSRVQEAQDSNLDKVDTCPNKMFSLLPIIPPGKSKDSSSDLGRIASFHIVSNPLFLIKSTNWHFTYQSLTHSLTHGAEPFLRNCQLCSHSRTSQCFMEPVGSLPCSQEPSTGPYPEPDRFNPHQLILSLKDPF